MVKIEIWSDIVCPFCYIGKRNLEAALAQDAKAGEVEIVWKSFQLDPDAARNPGGSTYERLAEKYGRTVAQAKQMCADTAARGAAVGLKMSFDTTVPANTFDAHRLIHLAAAQGKQGEAQERLMAAYFTDGENVADHGTLARLAAEIGVTGAKEALASGKYEAEVEKDRDEAAKIGINGVPFFLFDRKFAVSGAQPVEVFTKALRVARGEEELE